MTELQENAVTPQVVKEQLNRLISSAHFNHSRRYPNFLSYVVFKTLEGHQEELKERSIGIDVFQRAPAYDLNVDPVVRVTAGEVRKRLAQYYYEPEHQQELRIEMRPGSYVPEFKQVAQAESHSEKAVFIETTSLPAESKADAIRSVETPSAPVPIEAISATGSSPGQSRLQRVVVFLTLGLVLVLAVIGVRYVIHRQSAFDHFWQPMLTGPNPVVISVGSWGNDVAPSISQISIGSHAISSDPIALADTVTIGRLQQVLSKYAKSSVIQSAGQTSFSELQRGPTILISGFDNQWTMRLTDPLRFHFVAKTGDLLEIEDRINPGKTDWQIDTKTPYAGLHRDFGILARFQDATTDQTIMIAAGVGENGTIAVGEMLTDETIFAKAQQSWPQISSARNMEAVVETQVIDGKSGPPRIIALYSW